jgi:hypothetical protein
MPSMWSAHDDCRARGKGRSPRLLDLQVSNLHAVRKIRSGGLRECVSLRSGLNTRTCPRFNARMTPIRANIEGPF